MTMEVLDGRSQEGNPLLKLRGEGLLQQLPEAEDHPDDGHPLQHTVHILQPLEQLLHDVGLVKVGPQRDQDLLVHQHELPELGHLTLYVPHQGLVQELDTIGSYKIKHKRVLGTFLRILQPRAATALDSCWILSKVLSLELNSYLVSYPEAQLEPGAR